MNELVKFVLARLADEGSAAGLAWADSGWQVEGKKITSPRDVVAKVGDVRTANFIVRNRPARVLAQCAALREITLSSDDIIRAYESRHAENADDEVWTEAMTGAANQADHTLRTLASIWSDHEDYRPEEWA